MGALMQVAISIAVVCGVEICLYCLESEPLPLPSYPPDVLGKCRSCGMFREICCGAVSVRGGDLVGDGDCDVCCACGCDENDLLAMEPVERSDGRPDAR